MGTRFCRTVIRVAPQSFSLSTARPGSSDLLMTRCWPSFSPMTVNPRTGSFFTCPFGKAVVAANGPGFGAGELAEVLEDPLLLAGIGQEAVLDQDLGARRLDPP